MEIKSLKHMKCLQENYSVQQCKTDNDNEKVGE